MYDAAILKAEIFKEGENLIGFRQETDPESTKITPAFAQSITGKYFDDVHGAIKLSTLFKLCPKFEEYEYPIYDNSEPYKVGDVVFFNGDNYTSKTNGNQGNDPIGNQSDLFWSLLTIQDQKTNWLMDKVKGYTINVIDDWINGKQNNELSSSIIEERTLFDGDFSELEEIPNENKVVGFEIKVAQSLGILATIKELGFHFVGSGDLIVRLYHSSSQIPLKEQTVTINSSEPQHITLNWALHYIGGNFTGGTFRIEYEQTNGLTAINTAKNFSSAYSYESYDNWKLWSNYVQFTPFEVGLSDRFNPYKREVNYIKGYGLNALVSVGCDFTKFILRNKHKFSNVIQKGVAYKLLKEILENPESRVNASSLDLELDALRFDLYGNPKGRETGVIYEYEKALGALDVSTNGLSRLCLKCGNTGINIRMM